MNSNTKCQFNLKCIKAPSNLNNIGLESHSEWMLNDRYKIQVFSSMVVMRLSLDYSWSMKDTLNNSNGMPHMVTQGKFSIPYRVLAATNGDMHSYIEEYVSSLKKSFFQQPFIDLVIKILESYLCKNVVNRGTS